MADRRIPAFALVGGLILLGLFGPGGADLRAQQGFAGLGTRTEGYAAVPDTPDLRFPRDHGAHPDFRIEWWYLTANLTDEKGAPLGIQWTLFRQAVRPPARTTAQQDGATPATPWASDQLWMGHAALTTRTRHLFAEKLARDGVGQAGVQLDPFTAHIDDWRLSAPDTPGERLSPVRLQASADGFSYDLTLDARGPLVRHGKGGVSRKSDRGQVSIYLSQPFYEVRGRIRVAGEQRTVTGRAWLDREWSSQPLAADQTGWDWFSLHLSGGARLMLFRLRGDKGAPFKAGSWIAPDGQVTPLNGAAITMRPLEETTLAAGRVPTRWRVTLAGRDVTLTVTALNKAAWNPGRVAYWEGPVTVSGSHGGRGYLEMTGYDSESLRSDRNDTGSPQSR
ncbi:lipocalin-like domain-containing protein [Yunchengibacter salinarum]|uniref:lipocalin-like domain-containing protein n=1 Tax=Yunchengibacter salinarum TaxID=3133399 RepID=UPI0035B62360